MSSTAPTPKGSGLDQAEAATRVLLALWSLDKTKEHVKKGDLTKRVVKKNQKSATYQSIFTQLEEDGAIAISGNKFSLLPKGIEMLGEGLKNADFKFEGTIVGTWAANALLKWISQTSSTSIAPASVNGNGIGKGAIASYEDFKPLALETYDRLNQDYNFGDLVPIYRIRREIGDQTSRSHFNEWLLEMQADDILQLQGGSVEDSAPDKIEDSVTTKVSGLRCYAKRLTS